MGFESFLGNSTAVQTVRQMLRAERVPGALLFTGPEGVGKKTLALMLAQALNCQRRGPGGDDFCGSCSHCLKAGQMIAATREDLERRRALKDAARRVEGLSYFDLQLIAPVTRFILIEQIRQLRNVAYTRPFEFSRRVFVLDQAQAVHWQAVDLLLKVLEEPPDTTTLILICSNAFELRPTIRSRCRRVAFLPVEEPALREFLEREGRGSEPQRRLAARLSAGSVAKARAFDPEAFLLRRRPWVEWLDAVTGRPAATLAALEWNKLFDASRALTEKREEMEEILRIGHTLLRDLMLYHLTGKVSELANTDLISRIKVWVPRLGLEGIVKLKEGLDQAYRLQTRNVNPQLGLDALAASLLEGPEALSPAPKAARK
jgi:DNA polymerase III subunit delta'